MDKSASMNLPTIVRRDLHGVDDAGDVDAEVFCVNTSGVEVRVFVEGSSFTTVDDEEPTVVDHARQALEVLIAPFGVVLVHRVRGWEWDGHVGIVVSYEFGAGSRVVRRSYSLKRSGEPFATETGRRLGVVVPPDQVSTTDAPS